MRRAVLPRAAAVMIALGLSSCNGDSTGPVSVASVEVSPSSDSIIEVGQTVQLSATTKDAAGNVLTGRTVVWSSSNDAIATVSGTGLVTGEGAGTVTIRATSEGKFGTASVEVVITAMSLSGG